MTLDDLDLILDVRTRGEYAQGHVYGAALIETRKPPLLTTDICRLASKLKQMMIGVRADTAIGVYYQKGIRSALAIAMLRSMGYRNVYDLGGMDISPLPLVIE